jgi:hypothetical protein
MLSNRPGPAQPKELPKVRFNKAIKPKEHRDQPGG